jgi:RNA polymerase sigma factor (TIGR02999 family)
MAQRSAEVTALLKRAGSGDRRAREDLLPLVEDRLRAMAVRLFGGERQGHTLQPTALVDEVYVQLVGQDGDWEGRAQFYAIAAVAMRRFLARHARDRDRQKRGDGKRCLSLAGLDPEGRRRPIDLLDLEDALVKLETIRPRLCRIAEHRILSGLTNQETADSLDLGLRTVELEWRAARAWLRQELGGDPRP